MKCAVIGAGAWGTALANLLAENGHPTVIWAYEPDVSHSINEHHENPRFLSGIQLQPELRATSDRETAVSEAELIVYATPSHVLRDVAASAKQWVTPGATLVATLGPRRSRFGGWAAFAGTALADMPLGPGRATWTRPSLALGPALRFARSRWIFDVHVEAVAALLVVGSRGFAVTRQVLDFDPGIGGGARVGAHVGRWLLSFNASATAWLRPQRARIENLSTTADLPRFEILLSLGVGVGRFD